MAEQEVRDGLLSSSSHSKHSFWQRHTRSDFLIQITKESIAARLAVISQQMVDKLITVAQYMDEATMLQAQLGAYLPK